MLGARYERRSSTENQVLIKDLPNDVMAAKSDWSVAEKYIGCTPSDDTVRARLLCQNSVCGQFKNGYVLEYITEDLPHANPGTESDEEYQERKAKHEPYKGRLIGVHRLHRTARPLIDIIGDEAYERLQDKFALGTRRWRWSATFEILERNSIIEKPKAYEVFGEKLYHSLFRRTTRELRPLTDAHRVALADVEIERIEISDNERARIKRDVEEDFAGAFEGMTKQGKAERLYRETILRETFLNRCAATMRCDHCDRNAPKAIRDRARSFFDVHHKKQLADGVRFTRLEDLNLLCPNCHRVEHIIIRQAKKK
jgi:5-methylcytosine-specific restriction protein A